MPNSSRRLLRREVFKQPSDSLLGVGQFVFRSLELFPQILQFGADIACGRRSRRVPRVDTTSRPDVNQALSFEEAQRRAHGVAGYAVLGNQPPVRRELRAWRILSARFDLSPQQVGQPPTLQAFVLVRRHYLSLPTGLRQAR